MAENFPSFLRGANSAGVEVGDSLLRVVYQRSSGAGAGAGAGAGSEHTEPEREPGARAGGLAERGCRSQSQSASRSAEILEPQPQRGRSSSHLAQRSPVDASRGAEGAGAGRHGGGRRRRRRGGPPVLGAPRLGAPRLGACAQAPPWLCPTANPGAALTPCISANTVEAERRRGRRGRLRREQAEPAARRHLGAGSEGAAAPAGVAREADGGRAAERVGSDHRRCDQASAVPGGPAPRAALGVCGRQARRRQRRQRARALSSCARALSSC